MAISCVIPACLNTNIQTAQLQHKPGKRGAEEALHCVPSRCRADGKRLGPLLPGLGSGTAGSRCPPDERLCILLLPPFLSPGPREAELKVPPLQGAKRVGRGGFCQRPSAALVWAQLEQDEVVTALLHQWFPPLCPAQSPSGQPGIHNPFLSQEPTFGAGGTLFTQERCSLLPASLCFAPAPVSTETFGFFFG